MAPWHEALRVLGPFPSLQVVAPPDHELVANAVDLVLEPFTLQYHGGATIAHPKLVLVDCGSVLDADELDAFAKDLMEGGYLSELGYAGCTNGQFLGRFPGPAIPPGTYTDGMLQGYVRQFLAQPGAPQPDGSTIYSMLLPEDVVAQLGAGQASCPHPAFCGYHNSMSSGQILYTIEPSTACPACNQGDEFEARTMVLSHEVAETVSNPTGQGWYEDRTGKENGDAVAWVRLQYGRWAVQGYGSPDGRNLMGAFNPPAAAFSPDPAVVADMLWIGNTSWPYIRDRYLAGDLPDAAAELGALGVFAGDLAAFLTQGAPHPFRPRSGAGVVRP